MKDKDMQIRDYRIALERILCHPDKAEDFARAALLGELLTSLKQRRVYLISFLRGCAIAADTHELGVELGRLMVNGDLMREAADAFEALNDKTVSVEDLWPS